MPGAGNGGTGARWGVVPVERAGGALGASSKTEKESEEVATSGSERARSPAIGVSPAREVRGAASACRVVDTSGASISAGGGAIAVPAGAAGEVARPLVGAAGREVRSFILTGVVVVLMRAPPVTASATVPVAGVVALVTAAVAAAIAGAAGPALPAVEETVAAAAAAACPAVFVT